MNNDLTNKYFVKNMADAPWVDITSAFDGVRVLRVSGFLKRGKPVNIYTAQWVNEQAEDVMVTTLDSRHRPVVIRENINLDLTFIVRQKYAQNTIDVLQAHDSFIDYMTGGPIWIKSVYADGLSVKCVVLEEYEPTVVKLQRGDNSWVLGTLKFHALDSPAEDE